MSHGYIVPPADWRVAHTLELPTREARVVSSDTLPVDPRLADWLAATCPEGVYTHQAAAITAAARGDDVCLVTGTASGKTLAFHAAAIGRLLADPQARVIAVYPQKSLASQQLDRWTAALSALGLPGAVRIDGDIPVADRPALLEQARVVVMTPDVMHAWLMANLGNATVRRFVRHVTLVVLDELHVYTGVMGTNSAFLFRRLKHAHANLGGAGISFFAASATIREPAQHQTLLTGRTPVLVGEEQDGSPRRPVTIHMVEPPTGADMLNAISGMINKMLVGSARFLMFSDSRKQTEMLATMLSRKGRHTDAPSSADADADTDDGDDLDLTRMEGCVLPYRSGYEPAHRQQIERALQQGRLRGVISTSAMELGLDIPGLDLAVLIGVPASATSLRQRIGRIGRTSSGTVWIINTGAKLDSAVFRQPETLLDRPPAEGALYLENPHIQYMHAVCMARVNDGEHDLVSAGCSDTTIASSVTWPEGFLTLCARERAGELTAEQRTMRAAGEDRPHLKFPLRDAGLSFEVACWSGNTKTESLGAGINHAQVMREAYPGAVHLHYARSYRVMGVQPGARQVRVHREKKHIYTKPILLPIEVQPNLTVGSLHRLATGAQSVVLEADAFVKEAITGYVETRGGSKVTHNYPNQYHQQKAFVRNMQATAALLWVPAFDGEEVGLGGAVLQLAELLYEALLVIAPFDRQDVGFAVSKYRGTTGHLPTQARFIALHDWTYGSLRLSGRFMDAVLTGQLVKQARWLFDAQAPADRDERVGALLDAVEAGVMDVRAQAVPGAVVDLAASDDLVPALKPGSLGYRVDEQHREVQVERVFFHRKFDELFYEFSIPGEKRVPGNVMMTPVRMVIGAPDQHEIGQYNIDMGTFV